MENEKGYLAHSLSTRPFLLHARNHAFQPAKLSLSML
jgi:hypothetical protein